MQEETSKQLLMNLMGQHFPCESILLYPNTHQPMKWIRIIVLTTWLKAFQYVSAIQGSRIKSGLFVCVYSCNSIFVEMILILFLHVCWIYILYISVYNRLFQVFLIYFTCPVEDLVSALRTMFFFFVSSLLKSWIVRKSSNLCFLFTTKTCVLAFTG